MATLNPGSTLLADDARRVHGDDYTPTTPRRGVHRALSRRRRRVPPRSRSRGAYLLAAATLGALIGVSLVAGPAVSPATATQQRSESASVADALGIDGAGVDQSTVVDRELLEQLAASRAQRDAEQAAAAASQAQAEQAAAQAQAEAEARAAAEAAATAEAAAAAPAHAAPPTAGVANITSTAGTVRPQTQAAADAVVSNVSGANAITIGGTRGSATDPNGHPSGLALDYMVLSDISLGDAIVQYHINNWDALGVQYLIYRQRMLTSPNGSWEPMEDRGSVTQNHMDHVHVNYRP